MRIALISETFPPEVNGVALTVYELAMELHRQGHQVSIVRPKPQESCHDLPEEMEQLLVPGLPLPRYEGLQFGFPAFRRMMSAWRHQRPDALYVSTEGPLGYTALRAAGKLGIPAATGFHTRFDQFAGHYGFGAVTELAWRYLRRFHNQGSVTLVPTDELRQLLLGRGFANVAVLERAVNVDRFDPARRDMSLRASWGAGEDTPVVIYVGRIAPEKNLALTAEAFEAFRTERPDAKMVWVGDGPARAALEQAHPDHIFAGVQRGDELGSHFASADVFLFASTTETFGNVTLEGLASGLAVVAYDYAAARQHIRHGVDGVLVPFDNRHALIRNVRQLAQAPMAIERLRGRARDAVAHLAISQVADDFVKLVANLDRREAA